MKKLFIVLLACLGLAACNKENNFPDFDYTTGYFPYQFPERILVLGDYIFENENDNNHQFVISAAMGGVYKNKKDRVFNIQVDESLCKNIYFSNGDPIKALPQNYYTMENTSQIVIPSGQVNGGVKVQLTDAFFADPDAIKNTYVVPVRMISSNDVDSILVGSTTLANPDIRIASDWTIAPKNFTMFGIKFINEWHGNNFHYGKCTVTDASGAVLENKEYKAKYVESNEVVKLVTTGRYTVSLSTQLNSGIWSKKITLNFAFSGDNCTITGPDDADYTVTGTGDWKQYDTTDYNSFGNKKRYALTYNFTLIEKATGKKYTASDVLVQRDRAVTLETYTPKL